MPRHAPQGHGACLEPGACPIGHVFRKIRAPHPNPSALQLAGTECYNSCFLDPVSFGGSSFIQPSVDKFMTQSSQSRCAYSRSGSHPESIGCRNFNKVGTNFNILLLWAVKIRFHTSHFFKGQISCGLLAHHIPVEMQMPPRFYNFHQNLVCEASYMKPTPTLQLQLWYHHGIDSAHDTCAPILSAKIRRISSQNKWVQQTQDIGNMFGPTFGFTLKSIEGIKLPKVLQSSIFLYSYTGKICTALCFFTFII